MVKHCLDRFKAIECVYLCQSVPCNNHNPVEHEILNLPKMLLFRFLEKKIKHFHVDTNNVSLSFRTSILQL